MTEYITIQVKDPKKDYRDYKTISVLKHHVLNETLCKNPGCNRYVGKARKKDYCSPKCRTDHLWLLRKKH